MSLEQYFDRLSKHTFITDDGFYITFKNKTCVGVSICYRNIKGNLLNVFNKDGAKWGEFIVNNDIKHTAKITDDFVITVGKRLINSEDLQLAKRDVRAILRLNKAKAISGYKRKNILKCVDSVI